jgi:hypothetical protein
MEIPRADEEVQWTGGSVDAKDVDVASGERVADVSHLLDADGEFITASGWSGASEGLDPRPALLVENLCIPYALIRSKIRDVDGEARDAESEDVTLGETRWDSPSVSEIGGEEIGPFALDLFLKGTDRRRDPTYEQDVEGWVRSSYQISHRHPEARALSIPREDRPVFWALFAVYSQLEVCGDLKPVVLTFWTSPRDTFPLFDHSLDDGLLVRIGRKAKAL